MKWPMVKLESVAEINPRLPKNVDEGQTVSFVAMASASEDGRLLSEENRVLSETKKGFTYFNKGDVLLAKITPCFENGKCLRPNQISNPIGFGSTEFHVLRANLDELDSQYLFYMLWNAKFRSLGEASMSGAAGQKRVSTDFLKSFQIPLPPLAEQQRIAAILDKADAIRRKRQQAIQFADDFLRAVFLDMFGDPVTNPKGWEVTFMTSHGSFKNGLNFGKGEVGNTLRYLGVGDFKSLSTIDDVCSLGSVELDTLPAKDYLLENDDLVFVRSNGNKALVGRCITVYPNGEPLTFSGFCIRYRVESGDIESEYLNYLFRTPSMKQAMLKGGQGANIQNINQKILAALEIPLPPELLQEKFSKIVRVYRDSRLHVDCSSTDADSLFAAISQRAFRGEL